MLEFWEMWSTPSLPSLPDPLWLGVVAPERVLSMGLFDILNWVRTNDLCKIEFLEIDPFDHLIVSKQMTDVKLIVRDT